jgi:hypothetical protein
MEDFHKIKQGGHATEGDLDTTFLIPKLQPFQNINS